MNEHPVKWGDKDAYVLPVLPESLGIDPQFAALLHAAAFLEISGKDAVDPDWAVEALEHLAYYLHRLPSAEVRKLGRQLDRIGEYARENDWPENVIEFIVGFFAACGVGENSE